ncbi:MAG TPA: cardiolipin synthase [Gemmataceae bacterium]|nr:cardiolipin synthase [Gemmataceae bacterium]
MLLDLWPWLVGAAALVADLIVSYHIILYKRDSRAAVAWLGIVWSAPLIGATIYWVFGINRIVRRARKMRRRPKKTPPPVGSGNELPPSPPEPIPPEAAHLMPLAKLGTMVTVLPMCQGNTIQPLHTGDEAYPAMFEAIEQAQHSVALSMYIFNNDHMGQRFVEVLGRAVQRGIEVRVLVDGVGAQFGWHSIVGPLERAGVRTATFNPTLVPRYFSYANMRNHRKLLIADGRIGFTGGINIGDNYCPGIKPPLPIDDMQFRIEGPVVAHMQSTFIEDWKFATEETLSGGRWFPHLEANGTQPARGIASGPDEDFEKVRLVILGALSEAQDRICIMTPYFLPDAGLVSSLTIAALRGVQVDILIPALSDLRLLPWACAAELPQVLEYGCRVWLMPPPFRHTKLMMIDGLWTMLGSANMDARSLRLNFEFNIECYDRGLTEMLEKRFQEYLTQAERVTLDKLNRRSLPVKLRDGLARLLVPYL